VLPVFGALNYNRRVNGFNKSRRILGQVPPEGKDPIVYHRPTRKSVGYSGAVRLRDWHAAVSS
jgi:hypothetical protein